VQFQSAISPDASNIVSGSSDGNAYVWKVSFLLINYNEILLGLMHMLLFGYNFTELSNFRLTSLWKILLFWKLTMVKLQQLTGNSGNLVWF